VTALGDLLVRWTLQEDGDAVDVASSFDGEPDATVVPDALDPTPSTVDD